LPNRTSTRLVYLTAVVLAGAVASPGRARGDGQAAPAAPQQEKIPQIAGGRVEQVTVDVVVLDRKGKPVTGLTRGDFTVLEEGQSKTIASFDVIDRTSPEGEAVAPEPPPRVATNTGPAQDAAQAGRTFVILFDDLNLTFTNANHAKKAVAAFLDRGAVEGDRVTLLSTSGTAWWTTRMKGGREDLLAILKRLDGRRVLETASERLTDYEAFQIVYYRDVLVAARVQDRLERYGTKMLQAPDKANAQNAAQLFQRGVVDPFVENIALQTYTKAKTRMEASLATIERAIRALTEERSRKALLLVSEGFVDDPTQGGLKRVVEAARRVNATIYFVDANGLRALDPMYSAEFGPALDSRDTMTAIADLSREGEGAVVLADRTGGFSIRDTNAFEEGAVRIGRESQSYYLLGYNPGDIPRDGRFRKIEVRVRGGYTVRARRGYYAPLPEGETAYAPPKGVDPVLQQALDGSGASDAIPLRLTAYVMEDSGLDRTRVVLAADADVSRVEFRDVDGQAQATLDTLVVIAHRESGEALRTDQKVEIQRRPGVAANGGGPMWYSFLREFRVAPGEHQAKLVVRDAVSSRVGTVIYGFGVPAHDQFRVSTPVLTDTLTDPGRGSTPVLLTRRAFPQSAQLYCRFDVFGAAKGRDGLPQVRAGHALRHRGAEIVGRANPSLIEPTSLGAVARMVQIPLRAFPPGDYELVLTVTDEVSGASRELVEPFSVTPPMTASR
jgi:VWFA-related protein